MQALSSVSLERDSHWEQGGGATQPINRNKAHVHNGDFE